MKKIKEIIALLIIIALTFFLIQTYIANNKLQKQVNYFIDVEIKKQQTTIDILTLRNDSLFKRITAKDSIIVALKWSDDSLKHEISKLHTALDSALIKANEMNTSEQYTNIIDYINSITK